MSNAELASLKEKFLEWFAKKSQEQLNILITGKTGVGKSRLVNGLVGFHVAKEGRERKDCTGDVAPYSAVIEGIEVRVWDSPGLQDRTCNEEIYLAKLKDKLKDGFDVMIYCIKMDDKRFYSEDEKAMRALTKGFGDDLWKKAVIALTFANKIEDPDGGDKLAYFEGEKFFWRKAIEGFLTNLNIDLNVRNSIAVIPAGNYKQPKLPTGDKWISELWLNCFCGMTDSAGLALYQINKNRLKFSCSTKMAIDSASSESKDEMPAKSDASEDAEGPGDFPEITFDAKQEDTFFSTMWKAFVASGFVGVSAGASFIILKLFFRR